MSLTEINAIDENYPVAGIDQSSQTFRDNFANIKIALTDLDTVVVTVINDLTDVDTTSVAPVTDDALVFDGVNWVPGFSKVVLDTTPSLGGNLNVGAFGLSVGGEVVVSFDSGGETGVNNVEFVNGIATQGVIVRAVGTDTNIDMTLGTKGTGSIIIDSGTVNSRIAAIADSSLEIATEDNVAGSAPNITIIAGSSTGSAGDGGSVSLQHGAEDTTGTPGAVFIKDQDGANIVRFRGTTSGAGVNFFAIRNATAGTPPAINATGSDTDINLEINPKGTGRVRISGLAYPNVDGSTNKHVLKTSGTGFLSFFPPTDLGEFTTAGLPAANTRADAYALATDWPVTGRTIVRSDGTDWKAIAVEGIPGSGIANVVEDTTPQLGGHLDVNGKQIRSVSNGNIAIKPDGTGEFEMGFVFYSKRISQPIVDNTTAVFLTYTASPQSAMFVDYLIIRTASNVRTGTLTITNNAGTVSVLDTGTSVGDVQVTFSGAINTGNVEISYIAAATASAGAMQYQTRRFEDT